eukprot:gene3743-4683_t
MQNMLLQAQAATAEAVRESAFEKRVTKAIGQTRADTNLQRMGGALATAVGIGARDKRDKSVHFEIDQTPEKSDSSSTSYSPSDSESRRERQRRKRAKGAEAVAQATNSGSGRKDLGSSGTSPDPKGAAFRAMLNAAISAGVGAFYADSV